MKASTPKTRCFLLLIAFTVGLANCTKKEKLSECLDSCTIVTGRLLTSGSAALPDVPVTLRVHFVGLYRKVHEKSIGKTDANGYYRVSGFLTDEELSNAYLEVAFEVSKSKYYLISEPAIAFHDYKRDTLLTSPDYLIPRKAFAKLAITYPNQITGLGSYTSTFNGCYAVNTTFSQTIQGGGSVINWASLPTQNPLEMPADQAILVQHYKNVNKGIPSATDTLFIPAGTTKTYTVTY